ncbi:hypothetical protein KDA14_04250 [Candidatus Saccharibacteria bacterium]|nr:hypothetical protein [Candidatus Saccharibacteria bacterium]
MQSLTSVAQHIDRRVKGLLREHDEESLPKSQRADIRRLRLACNEIKLDVRDYEYAETRTEQLKWRKIATHNIGVAEHALLALGDIFSPADVAELGAQLGSLAEKLE